MENAARKVRRLNLQDRMKRLNARANSLSGNMNRIGDTVFALKARIAQHSDELGEEEVQRLTEKIRKNQIRYDELEVERDILRSGISYLNLNRAAIEDGAEEIRDVWEVE